MQNSLVSIVLPVYNGEKYLAQSIESVLNQTYSNLELIIVNDNSSDNSLQIAQTYANNDKRIKIITNEINQKLPESLNIGFRSAKGKYYSWTSDDNFYHNDAIEKMVNHLEKYPNDVAVNADFYKLDVDSNETMPLQLNTTAQNMINGNCMGACFLYRADIAKQVGEYKKDKFLVEDYDYWLRMMLQGNFGHISEFLYTYRIHSKSLTGTRMQEILEKTKEIQNEYYPIYKEKYNIEIISQAPAKQKVSLLEHIFSVKNNGNKKIIRILGFKISIKRY